MNQTVTDLDKKARMTLEYDKVLDMLAEQAGCDGARERAKRLCPAVHADEVRESLALTGQPSHLRGEGHFALAGACPEGGGALPPGAAAGGHGAACRACPAKLH